MSMQDAHVLIIEARFYVDIADELAAGAIAELQRRDATFDRLAVPGALEIPAAVRFAIKAMELVGRGHQPRRHPDMLGVDHASAVVKHQP